MRIALIGYGKMGKAIEEAAVKKGHEIVLRIDQPTLHEFTKDNLQNADVAIEFTGPHSAFENVKKCIEWKVPVVCGSTGWTEHLDEMKSLAINNASGFIYSSNYSVGVNIFFEVNKKLAELMNAHDDYSVQIEETHHTQKKDAPSGTAISIAEQILEKIKRKNNWVTDLSQQEMELTIISKREDPAPGTHRVEYSSPIDTIEIIHTAHNRTGFASGAVLAAEFLKGRAGFFTMKDVLNF